MGSDEFSSVKEALSYFLKVPVAQLEYVTVVDVKNDIATVAYVWKGKRKIVELDLSKQHMKMFTGDWDAE